MRTAEKVIEKNWFEKKIKDETIKVYLEYILLYKRQQLKWYVERRKKARQNSWKHLLPALIFFGSSLIFPLLAGVKIWKIDSVDVSTYYAFGYISLILSTLLLLADRLFIHSKSWIRYSVTLNQLELISSKYYAQWIIILPQIGPDSGAIGLKVKKEAITLLNHLDLELKEVIKTETDNWKDVFTGQLDDFNKQAESSLNNMKTEISDFVKDEKANISNYAEVTIEIQILDIKPEQKVYLELCQNEKTFEKTSLDSIQSKWHLWNVNIGVYKLVLNVLEDEKLIKTDSQLIELNGDKNVHKEELYVNTTNNK